MGLFFLVGSLWGLAEATLANFYGRIFGVETSAEQTIEPASTTGGQGDNTPGDADSRNSLDQPTERDPDAYRTRMWKGKPLPSDRLRNQPQEERMELLHHTHTLFPQGQLRYIKSSQFHTPPQHVVNHQLQHVTYAPVLTDEEADEPCAEMECQLMLDKLNDLLATSYVLSNPGLFDLLEDCRQKKYDFGMVYGRLRSAWHEGDFVDLVKRMEDMENTKWRNGHISSEGRHLKQASIPPRRAWDLYSNRVLPYALCSNIPSTELSAVSHAWVHISERQLAKTPINGMEWPVPMPNDVSLSQVRIELLNLGIIYCWLDVLCLRQQGAEEDEEIRKDEWKVDVPTIGKMYQVTKKIATYYNGLGRPFVIQPGDLDGERHWLNRAWTVQERSDKSLTAGICPISPKREDVDSPEVFRFYSALDESRATVRTVMGAINLMRRCFSTTEVDKIGVSVAFHFLTYILAQMVALCFSLISRSRSNSQM